MKLSSINAIINSHTNLRVEEIVDEPNQLTNDIKTSQLFKN